jgi:hypothetical protein
MIIVSLKCQMGNQLFQYAFGVANARRLHTLWLPYLNSPYYPFRLQWFVLDPVTHFLLDSEKISKLYTRICRKWIKVVNPETITDKEWELAGDAENNCYFDGFFQSDAYFNSHESIIKRRFRIKAQYRKSFTDKYGTLFAEKKVIVVHLRRTDYNEVGYDTIGGAGITLPLSYYQKAINTIPKSHNYKLLFIGDDMESIKKDFGHIEGASFERNDAITDFQLIQHADIAIIANSTFAWWAAYLTQKEGSRIIAPAFWWGFKVRKEFPAGICTRKFAWIEF